MISPNRTASFPGLIFAYGTLKPLTPEAAEAGGWTPDAVRGRLFDLGPYPGLVDLNSAEAPWVEGFVRPVSEEELRQTLDPYEAVDEGLFAREITVTRGGGTVWIYTYARPLPDRARGPLTSWSPPSSNFVPNLAGRPYSKSGSSKTD